MILTILVLLFYFEIPRFIRRMIYFFSFCFALQMRRSCISLEQKQNQSLN